MQEIVLSTNEPIFAVGDYRISHSLLKNFTNFLRLISAAHQMTGYIRHAQESVHTAAQQIQAQEDVSEIMKTEEAHRERFNAIQAICATTAIDVMIGFRLLYSRLRDERPHTLHNVLKHTIIRPGREGGENGIKGLLATCIAPQHVCY